MLKAIMAHDINYGIGVNNQLPWKCPEDLKYFKQCTSNHVIVMGTNTWKSLGCKPLPNRVNVVLTNHYDATVHGNADIVIMDKQVIAKLDNKVVFMHSGHVLDTVVRSVDDIYEQHGMDVWIIGGADIYRQFMPHVEELHSSLITGEYECDTFLNPLQYNCKFDLSSMRVLDGMVVSIYR